MQEIKMLDMRSHVSNLTIEDINCCMERASSAHVALLKKGNNGRICIKRNSLGEYICMFLSLIVFKHLLKSIALFFFKSFEITNSNEKFEITNS